MNTSGSASAPSVNEIRAAKYISFVSTRKNGTPVATPVWVAPLDYLAPNVVGFTIDANAGKAKRLSHTNTVTVQPCDIRGRIVEGSPVVHGTAIVVLAALRNALKFVKKDLGSVKIVLSGVGAAGNAIARLLTLSGAKNIIGFNHHGVIHNGMKSEDSMQQWFIDNSNPNNFIGTMPEALVGADVFIGVSAPNILKEADIATMAKGSIIFALANPDPEVDPVLARKYATVVATGRSDQPNQINNVLAFPGIFRGLLDANAHKITDKLLVAAAEAIADCVSPEQLNASFIVPSVFDPNVTKAVAAAVKKSV